MTEKALALQLADDLEIDYAGEVVPHKSAAALRRLHAENEMLWKEREEPHQQIELYLRECNRLESERDELRKVNAELLEALKDRVSRYGSHSARQEDKPKTFACRHMAETCSHCEDLVADWKAFQAARAAIAKAEGGQT
jgi:hypothetical protein